MHWPNNLTILIITINNIFCCSNYIQTGTQYFLIFFPITDRDVETHNVSTVPTEVLDMVEADTFWCMSKLLDGIQDNYTFAQPGIQMKVSKLQNLITRIDGRSLSRAEYASLNPWLFWNWLDFNAPNLWLLGSPSFRGFTVRY